MCRSVDALRRLVLLLVIAALLPVARAAASGKRNYEVAAGDAATTLRQFVEQSGEQVIYLVPKVRGVKTNPVKGEFTAREVADQMVANTGLMVVEDAKTGALMIQRKESGKSTLPVEPNSKAKNVEAPKLMKTPKLVTVIAGWFALALTPVISAQTSDGRPAGVIEGRVFNATSGSYLNNARVVIDGTRIETFTNESGEFRLSNVPPGPVRILALFTGLEAQAATVAVAGGQVATQDFSLSRTGTPATGKDGSVIKLDQFVVASSREMNAADIANNEQRYAANIKNVVDADAYGDAGEGNLGEFLKFVPGVTVNYSSFDARTISVRGMPSHTTSILVDGNPFASAVSSGASRDVEVGGLMMNNISRVEVSKTPTPDSPANAMGGTVNVVNKGAFDRSKPIFTYRVSAIMNSNWITLKEMPGGQPESTGRRVLPGVDFSYIAPITKTFGITVNGFYTQRYSGTQMTTPTWRPVNGGSNFGTAEDPFLNSHSVRDQPTHWERMSFGSTIDWKVGLYGMLTVGTQFSSADMHQNIEQWTTSLTGTSNTRPLGYDATFAQSADGAASSVISTNARRKTDRTLHSSVKYRHNGPIWKFDGGGFYSRSTNTYRDVDFGHFSATSVRITGLNMRYDAINTVRKGPGTVDATTTAGVPVDLFSLNSYSLQSSGSNQLSSKDALTGAHVNARRTLDVLRRSVQVRAGADVRRQDRDIRNNNPAWTFVGPDGLPNTADDRVANYDILDPVYSSANAPFDLPQIQRPSPYKLWQLYKSNANYFRFEEANFINTSTAASRKITETISAAYLRLDGAFFNNRLRLTGGARYERTVDVGYGRLADIRATYQQNADGSLIRDAAGRPIRVTTNAVELARLQYVDRGAHARREYGDFYPSINGTYNITDNFQVRAAFARTIGRPNFNEIIPNITVTDPAATEVNRTITVVNSGLKPWSADNFDLSFEYYFEKSGRVAISGFQKEIKDFFGATRTPATPELLANFGLNDDYLDYDIITKENVGNARVSGIDFDYQQPLSFLPNWARGTMVFFNMTKTHLEGNSTANFSGFTRESINWGVSVSRPRYNVKLTWNMRGRQRQGQLTGTGVPPGTYVYLPDYLTLNVNAEYRFTRRLAAFTVIRNIANKPLIEERYGSVTPNYARISNYQNLGSQISIGLKGEF